MQRLKTMTLVSSETYPVPSEHAPIPKEAIIRSSFLNSPLQQFQSMFGPLSVKSLQEHPRAKRLGEDIKYSHMLLLKERGNAHFRKDDHEMALYCWKDAFNAVTRDGRTPLARSYYHEDYITMMRKQSILTEGYIFPLFLTMVSCCNNIAQVYLKRGDYSTVSILLLSSPRI